MKHGICKMCLVPKDLVRSHLLPAALYEYCRTDDVDPVRVGDGFVVHTSRQTQDHLLCAECEEILNKGGESWVIPQLCTVLREFPLYELVISGPTACQDTGGGLYFATDNPRIDVEKLAHFGMGIFWKASVHSWRGNTRRPMIELGDYSDAIRLWLRHDAGYPKDVTLWVTLSRPQHAQITLNPPVQTERKGWSTFFTHMLGLIFMINVGEAVPFETKMSCFYKISSHPILISDDVTGILQQQLSEHYHESRKTHAFLSSRAKRAERT